VIVVLSEPATHDQVEDMLETLGSYIKLAVDVEQGRVAGGGELHADCEAALLEAGSRQEDIWGADWDPTGEVRFESLINIRPRQDNRSLEVQAPELRHRIEQIVRYVFEGE
jgi:hypothetical protein